MCVRKGDNTVRYIPSSMHTQIDVKGINLLRANLAIVHICMLSQIWSSTLYSATFWSSISLSLNRYINVGIGNCDPSSILAYCIYYARTTCIIHLSSSAEPYAQVIMHHKLMSHAFFSYQQLLDTTAVWIVHKMHICHTLRLWKCALCTQYVPWLTLLRT